jgi:FkbM family methyltransferase
MRLALFYDPRLLLERLSSAFTVRRRLAKLRGTVARNLKPGHIESLELLELLRSNPPKVIYDIGANVGTWTLLAKALFPNATVHAFEPLSKHQAVFEATAAVLEGVHLHPVALGASEESRPMRIADFSDESSLLPFANESKNAAQNTSEIVQIVALDHYASLKRLPMPDLIKLDVQGYEVTVLEGATACLESAQAIITEVSFIPLYRRQCLFHDVVAFCASRRFYLRAVARHTAIGQRLNETDALFEKPNNISSYSNPLLNVLPITAEKSSERIP